MSPIEEMKKELSEIGLKRVSLDNGAAYIKCFIHDYIMIKFESLKYPNANVYFYTPQDKFYKGEYCYYTLDSNYFVGELYGIYDIDKTIKKLKKIKKRLEKIKADLQPILDKYNIKELYDEISENN